MHLAVTKDVDNCDPSDSAVASNFGSTKPSSTKLTSATRCLLALAVLSVLLLTAVQPAGAQRESVLYSFSSRSRDGQIPLAGLIRDKKGNLYGTTDNGGANGYGTVFKLTRAGAETVLYSFGSQSGDGTDPGGLIMDKLGNLYGTTFYGGANGRGTVFKLTPSGNETVLYSFGSQPGDGANPQSGLSRDKEEILYGTTCCGGANGIGTVFRLTPSGVETVLYSFGSQPGDGINPGAGLIMDKKGNLYGTTYRGGAYSGGTVFKVTPSGTETVLYGFGSQRGDGGNPYAGPIMDAKGNLYGTTFDGGTEGYGTVFKLTPSGVETLLLSFTDGYRQGVNPTAGLVMDKRGNLYGTTSGGFGNFGVVFELSPGRKERPWAFTCLHVFNYGNGDGLVPSSGTLILDKVGSLYGTTSAGGKYARGGAYGYGTVFKVVP